VTKNRNNQSRYLNIDALDSRSIKALSFAMLRQLLFNMLRQMRLIVRGTDPFVVF
tara:strand:+ start:890 stop:1054 length:165 start_codon:yes stop_codon:yes gene_type:complete